MNLGTIWVTRSLAATRSELELVPRELVDGDDGIRES